MEQTIGELLDKTKEYEDFLNGIETEDTSNEDLDSVPYSTDDIRISQKMYSVFQIYHWIENQTLILQPDFQRNHVWDIQRKSLLIESIMLRIPIPAFYFQEDIEGNQMVIDGLQRLSTIYSFMKNEFHLTGLQYLKTYEGCCYSDLNKKYMVRIQDTQLVVNVLDSKCSEQVKFDVFRRVNTGGVPLNSQEIRNIMATNSVRALLKKMSQSQDFLIATRGKVRDIRMDAQELCLRFITFYARYDANTHKLKELKALAQMLDFMIIFLNKKENEVLNEIISIFTKSMQKCYALLGENAFSKETSRHIINKPLFISWSVVMADFPKTVDELKEKQEEAIQLHHKYFGEENTLMQLHHPQQRKGI